MRTPPPHNSLLARKIQPTLALAWGCSKTYIGMKDGAALAIHLREATRTIYGTAARAFLDQLAEKRASDPSGLLASINARRQVFLDKILPAGADGQVISVCRRFQPHCRSRRDGNQPRDPTVEKD
jgi:hypothetical protein